MSWAARRTATRIEDRAYSLLGIFGVNMPQIYGEGQDAFRRLQEAILQRTNDLSIFAWTESPFDEVCGVLAPRPEAFSRAGTIKLMDGPNLPTPSFTVTNAAVEMSTSLGRYIPQSKLDDKLYEAPTPIPWPYWRHRLLHLHCTMFLGPQTNSHHGGNDTPHVVFLVLDPTRREFVRLSSSGLRVLPQYKVRFLEPVDVIMPKSIPRKARMPYAEWVSSELGSEILMIYLSGVKNYLNDQTMSVEYAVEAKLYPEHLFVSDLNVSARTTTRTLLVLSE